jgi:putative ABC transport system permease protein
MDVVGLLREGATVAQAQSEMDAITQNVRKDYAPLREKRLSVGSLRERLVEDTRVTLLTALACVGFLVLIACVNVANLLLSRATAREREIALRAALGASRRRLIQQLLTESIFLSVSGGILGLVLAYVLISRFIPHLPFIPAFSQDIQVDGWVLGFAVLLSLATGVAFGLVPALHAATPNLIDPLKSGNKTGTGDSGRPLRNILVVSELAMALVVLVAAGLLIRSFWMLSHMDPGFNTTRILTMSIFASDTRYKKSSDRVEFYRQLTDKLKALPGVESVGAVNRLPLNGSNILVGVTVPGSAIATTKPEMIDRRIADTGYFQTINIPLMKGRYFNVDDGPDSPKVAIVNEAMAQHFWPGGDPISHQATLAIREGVTVTIVGVVGNVLHRGLDKSVQPELYVPYSQAASEGMILVIRSAQSSKNLISTVRSQVWALDSQMPLDKMPTMEDIVSTSVAKPRFRTLLLSGFAVLALALSALGIYGVVSYSTARRIPEIGIRVALGAQRSNVLALILGQGIKLAALGVLIGVLVSFFVNQLLGKLLFRVTPNDPITTISVAALLILVAMVASYVPAHRALRVSPSAALRIE